MEESVESRLNICKGIEDYFELGNMDLRTVSPLTLAYIGDGIYDLIIRTIIVKKGNAAVNKLHKRVSDLVKANSQMIMYKIVEEELSEEELAIYKRGRNAKPYTTAKNATKGDYRSATGYECLLGYLYLDNNMDRIMYLVKKGLDSFEDYKKTLN